jgi:beta-glucosidase
MVPFLPGIRAAWHDSEILYAPGVAIQGGDTKGIAEAVAMARRADIVLLCLGEERYMSGEAASRAKPGLPGHQEAFATAIFDTGKPVIVLLSSGRPLIGTSIFDRAQAVLATWFLGSEAGHAVADIITGQWSPSAKLPVSWPLDVGQIPVFYAQRPTGRPANPEVRYSSKYLDLPNAPLFPFGHGLSYTRFSYSDFTASPSELRAGAKITLEVTVRNAGSVPAEETVFFFAHDPVASVSRPLLELKGMSKAWLEPGQAKTVTTVLSTDDLAFPGADYEWRLEPGAIQFFAGPAARIEDLLGAEVHVVA